MAFLSSSSSPSSPSSAPASVSPPPGVALVLWKTAAGRTLFFEEEVITGCCPDSEHPAYRNGGGARTLLLPVFDTVELVHTRPVVGRIAAERDLE